MKIAIVGCGFASHLYGGTLHNHPSLKVVGVFDRDSKRADLWLKRWGSESGAVRFRSMAALLKSEAELIVNLSDPASHYALTKAILLGNKHVYSEKPLGLSLSQAKQLVALAESRGLFLGCAPASLLGESAQTLWHAIQEGVVGKIHTVYASLSHPANSRQAIESCIRSAKAGPVRDYVKSFDFPVAWPLESESDIGCAYEHSGYILKWLTSWFGNVTKISTSSVLSSSVKYDWTPFAAKRNSYQSKTHDFFSSILSFEDGPQALVINSWILPNDFRIILCGEDGYLELENQWDARSPVWVYKPLVYAPHVRFLYPQVAPRNFSMIKYPDSFGPKMDFARGIAILAQAIEDKKKSPFACSLAQELHIQEITDTIANRSINSYKPKTKFKVRPQPLPVLKEVGIAVIGCGSASHKYISTLAWGSNARIRGVLSLTGSSKRASQAVACLEAARIYDSLDELLGDPSVDLVVNLSTPAEHFSITVKSIMAGKHVFSEKPLALRKKEALVIADLARWHNVRVGCAPAHFLLEPFKTLSKYIREGHLGKIHKVVAVVNHGAIEEWHPNPGPLYDLGFFVDAGLYPIALATWALGPVWKLNANGKTKTPKRTMPNGKRILVKTPDEVKATIHFAQGAVMDFRCSSSHTQKSWYLKNPSFIEFHGEKGIMRLVEGKKISCHHAKKSHPCKLHRSQRIASLSEMSLGVGVLDMKDAILAGKSHSCTLEHAVHLTEVAEAMREAMDKNIEMELETGTTRSSWFY